jgi:hypothetical protein
MTRRKAQQFRRDRISDEDLGSPSAGTPLDPQTRDRPGSGSNHEDWWPRLL